MASVFFPPELAVQQEFEELAGRSSDAQSNFLKKLYFQRLYHPVRDERADRQIVRMVLEQAKRVVAHPSRPRTRALDAYVRNPGAELALEESLEDSPFLEDPQDLLVEQQVDKPLTCTAILDCSSSMSGEKHLLASVAVAVLLLELQPKDTSLVVFASRSEVIKPMLDEQTVEETVLKFLRARPKGFTNIHLGLEAGLRQARRVSGGRRRVGLIATDGRSTEGDDPAEVARQFDRLIVLHLHGPGNDFEASQALARAGNGVCLDVERFSSLPQRLYEAIRQLGRR